MRMFLLFCVCSCCQVHDQCYSDSWQHDDCWGILDNPYTEIYSFACDKPAKKVSCNGKTHYSVEQTVLNKQTLTLVWSASALCNMAGILKIFFCFLQLTRIAPVRCSSVNVTEKQPIALHKQVTIQSMSTILVKTANEESEKVWKRVLKVALKRAMVHLFMPAGFLI